MESTGRADCVQLSSAAFEQCALPAGVAPTRGVSSAGHGGGARKEMLRVPARRVDAWDQWVSPFLLWLVVIIHYTIPSAALPLTSCTALQQRRRRSGAHRSGMYNAPPARRCSRRRAQPLDVGALLAKTVKCFVNCPLLQGVLQGAPVRQSPPRTLQPRTPRSRRAAPRKALSSRQRCSEPPKKPAAVTPARRRSCPPQQRSPRRASARQRSAGASTAQPQERSTKQAQITAQATACATRKHPSAACGPAHARSTAPRRPLSSPPLTSTHIPPRTQLDAAPLGRLSAGHNTALRSAAQRTTQTRLQLHSAPSQHGAAHAPPDCSPLAHHISVSMHARCT